jgi:hypothetical protein
MNKKKTFNLNKIRTPWNLFEKSPFTTMLIGHYFTISKEINIVTILLKSLCKCNPK